LPAFRSGVFSCLQAWVVAIVKRGFEGYMPNAKSTCVASKPQRV